MPPDPFGDALPVLDTQRLRLRHPRPADADAVLAIFGDPTAMRYWSHEPFEDLEAAQNYLATIDEGFAERTLFQWAITELGADDLIGTVTLLHWDRPNRRAEVGYMLSPSHWGKGYASEAVRAVLCFGFEAMDLHRVEAELDPRNEASARLLERLGFQQEGLQRQTWYLYDEWCDSALYGLLRTDFIAA
ncbi:MAG: GNAT family N-acetyltransferase [Rhodothermaceae bacterium]|nr:GNAT family N-acetyltransferase [Rhodothermaceae bacterium]